MGERDRSVKRGSWYAEVRDASGRVKAVRGRRRGTERVEELVDGKRWVVYVPPRIRRLVGQLLREGKIAEARQLAQAFPNEELIRLVEKERGRKSDRTVKKSFVLDE